MFLIIISVTLDASADLEMDLKCLVSHLRRNEINEELLSSVESTAVSALCNQVIDDSMASLYARLELDVKQKKFADCFKKGIETSGLKNAYLLSEGVKKLDVGWKLWKQSAKEDRFNQLLTVLTDGFKIVQSKCVEQVTKEQLGDDFDKAIFNRKNYRGDQEYCVRKHLVSNGVLDYCEGCNVNNIVLNPQSVNTNIVDCSFVVSSLQEITYQQMEQHVSKCKINVFRQHSYVDYYMKIELVLPQLGLTPENIAKERADFIKKIFSFKENADKICDE